MGVSTFRKKSFIKNGIYGVENDIFLCMVHKAVSIVLILNEYHQFTWKCNILSLFPKKIFWDVLHLRYLTDIWLYIWAVATIANSYYEFGRHVSSHIDCIFSSKMQFNHSAWPFYWYTCEVLISWITPHFLRKNCNSNITYSFLLSVCNLFTKWEVVFDHIWKIDLIASTASDFLYRKAILQKEK